MNKPNHPGDVSVGSQLYGINQQVLEWLADDEQRAGFYHWLHRGGCALYEFPSQALVQVNRNPSAPPPPPPVPPASGGGHVPAYLICGRKEVLEVLSDRSGAYSNAPYAALGSGSFMLALDPDIGMLASHQDQRNLARDAMRGSLLDGQLERLCDYACSAGAVLSLRATLFDLADYAEQSALRFCRALFGFGNRDHPLLESALRAAYRALNYQILGRHFVNEPATLPLAASGMAGLLARADTLIREYRHAGTWWPDDEGLREPALGRYQPVMKLLATSASPLNAQERASLVVGLMAGTVGNVQASVCIAVRAFFGHQQAGILKAAIAAAREMPAGSLNVEGTLGRLVAEALRLNPPVAFLPRRVAGPNVKLGGKLLAPGAELLLAVGAATSAGSQTFDSRGSKLNPLVFGLDPGSAHACLGTHLAMPLIVELVRRVLLLPGLAEKLDELDAKPIGLKKLWGFGCVSYPLTHRRDLVRRQQSLNVSMRIKPPLKDNAAALRIVIKAGAPRIEQVLREARHVHFAWFEFVDNDERLVLHTVYDGDFAAYIQHFALVAGDMFDQLFQYIEDAPPQPVSKYPNEFVNLVKRYNQEPACGYFFSAYPRSEVPEIVRDDTVRP